MVPDARRPVVSCVQRQRLEPRADLLPAAATAPLEEEAPLGQRLEVERASGGDPVVTDQPTKQALFLCTPFFVQKGKC